MDVEVIAIGNEVLSGFTINSNAATVSAALSELGLSPTSHRVLPDEVTLICEGVLESVRGHQLVICMGGLGPTGDDTTRQAACEIVGCELGFDEEVADRLEERFGKDFPTIKDQATIPLQATPLHNTVGTAPGLLFTMDNSTLIFLPGVPAELKAILHDQVVPYLKKHVGLKKLYREEIRYFQLPEARIDPLLREQAAAYPEVACGIYPSLGLVTVRLSSSKMEPEELVQIRLALEEPFKDHVLPQGILSLEEAVHRRCLEQNWTLATAESCTGGAVSARLTRLPGASGYFRGACVTYSNFMKEKILGVRKETIEKCGAVSEETVHEMVSGLLEVSGSDLGVAISGTVGPTGGTKEKPVGTVCFAVQRRGYEPVLTTYHHRGNRESNIMLSVNIALAEIWKLIRYN